MNRNLAIIIILSLLINGSGAVASLSTDQKFVEKTEIISFSSIQFFEKNEYTNIELSEATSYTTTPGGYMLPVVTQVYMFPFKTKITSITVSYTETQETIISKPVQLAPQPMRDDTLEPLHVTIKMKSWNIYPEQPFSYHIAAGRDGNNLVTYLAVHLYPIQYLPSENTIRYSKNAQISITSIPLETKTTTFDQYELVIIAPEAFSTELQPLVTHKINKDLTTKLVTQEDIYKSVYFTKEGRDSAEEMKYFIKNAFDQWGTKYVLLVGGRNGGITEEKWWIPVRYSHLNDDGEDSYLTDLYFADLYNANGNFSSWDSNNNGVFAEWTRTKKDILDMYPEIYIGRLPCTSIAQVKTMVNKIITYETTTYGTEWFKKFIGIAGDTYPSADDPYYEGELATNASFQQLQNLGFKASMLWTSNNRFTDPDSVINEIISNGAGFVHFSGHGNPASWSTHPPNNESAWVDGLTVKHMSQLVNNEKLPVVIVGGCHNAQFNTSLTNILKGVLEDGLKYFSSKRPFGEFWYYEWIPECWAWAMTTQTKGGAIAVIANTGLGYGEPGEHTLTELGRHLEWLFFKAYQNGKENLGETHATDIIYYMNEHPPMDDQIDCKIIQQWALLGDPTLMIGGYPS